MGSSDVDHRIPETLASTENSFDEGEEILDYLETQAPEYGKSGISGKKSKWRSRKKDGDLPEGHVAGEDSDDHLHGLNGQKEERLKGFSRAKSLTDDDIDELRGCLDLGFGFSYEGIPELCNTLPALDLCYSIRQRFMDEQHKLPAASDSPDSGSASGNPVASWRISSPGDHPDEVKARLKYWAQAVACTIRLCR